MSCSEIQNQSYELYILVFFFLFGSFQQSDVTLLQVLITCFIFFKGDDFRGFEAERKGSKGPVWSRQNPSKGKDILYT